MSLKYHLGDHRNRFHGWLYEHATWDSLRQISGIRLISGAYVWLLVVPVLAKFLSLVESPVDFSDHVAGLRLELALPFSWKVLYFSAICFSLAFFIYILRCPPFFRRYANYAEFELDGKSRSSIEEYVIAKGYPESQLQFPSENMESSHEGASSKARHRYILLREYESTMRFRSRCLCAVLYVLGFSGVAYLFVLNTWYVIQQSI